MTENKTLVNIRRLAGLDPDGPRVPMQPHETYDQCFLRMQVETDQHTRDAYLCRALRFT
jgi:hypothetical protein